MGVRLAFRSGTIEVHGLPEVTPSLPSVCVWDARTRSHRAPGIAYADVVLALKAAEIEVEDEARAYEEIEATPVIQREPRPYQREAIAAWKRARGRGVVVLPTGAGKTHVAVMGIELWKRSTLVIAPTLDLVRQWYDLLRATFDREIGLVGGGEHDVRPITVTTYDSAYMHVEHIGNRFGLVVFDECHHLPGPTYALAAQLAIAPFRLGLTATPERADGRETLLDELIGKTVYRRDIVELSGEFLADYDVVRIPVHLTPEERDEYEAERSVYRAFLAKSGIRMSQPDGWGKFIMLSARSAEGHRAMQAYRRQRELALTAPAKLDWVERLLHLHRHDRAILFTQDNATCYALSRRFLIPAITHQTKVKERSAILAGLSDGTYSAVATSKVLNEGVDVPDANVAIVVSGSGSVREHVQRLGRVLRKKEGKLATLYELVTADTGEAYTSERRRDHSAYAQSGRVRSLRG
ncbi:DEAD/DEAH box helicase family protein [Sandaracinus amylolyticus]|uniref:DEAD/DEAH box helicase family protein n=1 Tax=Sandaracinus amylolyticus TaxID=927083 RepID=UPI001F3E1F64|nr:DEAD/DEAH box helicase family protein [Sandaracinus amylolyticus]UJR79922.1 Type III restriction protein res subunit [Sandaracinus amylolyticus]